MPDNDDGEEGFVPFDDQKVVPIERKRRRFRLYPFAELLPKRHANYLVKGLIPRTGLVVVWGPPKCGKSFWTFDMVMHAAMGVEYRGHRVRQGNIVYCAFEGADGFLGRAEAFRRQHSVPIDLPFYLIPAALDLAQDHRELIADIRAQVPMGSTMGAVVLDTLNRSLGGSESSDEDMARYVRAADAIREAFHCVVIIVHHCGVNESRPRGHTSLTGAADAQLKVVRDENNDIVVTVEWNKDGPEGEVIRSHLASVELGTDDDGDPITSCVIEVVETAHTPKGAKVKLSPTATVALRLLADLILDVGSIPSTNARIPRETRTARTDDWRSYCYAGTITDSDNPDSKSKAFRRAATELQRAGRIGIWQDHVWLAGQPDKGRT